MNVEVRVFVVIYGYTWIKVFLVVGTLLKLRYVKC